MTCGGGLWPPEAFAVLPGEGDGCREEGGSDGGDCADVWVAGAGAGWVEAGAGGGGLCSSAGVGLETGTGGGGGEGGEEDCRWSTGGGRLEAGGGLWAGS